MNIEIPFYKRLSTRLVLAISVSFFVIIISSFTFVYMRAANTLKDSADANNILSFRQFEYNLQRFEDEIDLISKQLISSDSLNDLVFSDNMSQREKTGRMVEAFHQMNQVLFDYVYVESIVFFSSDALALIVTPTQNIVHGNDSHKGRFYEIEYQNIQRGNTSTLQWVGGYSSNDFIIAERSGIDTRRPVPYLSAYRQTYRGRYKGVVILNIDVTYFTNIYNHIHSNNGSMQNTYVVSAENIIVSHPIQDKIGERWVRGSVQSDQVQPYSFDGNGSLILCYPLSIADWTMVNETPNAVIFRDIRYLQMLVAIVLILGMILTMLFSIFWVRRITRPLSQVIGGMGLMKKGDLGLTLADGNIPDNEIGLLIAQFNDMSQSIHQLVRQNDEMQENKRQLEIQILKAQINPHFLYNTLTTIKWMAVMCKADNIIDSLTSLASLLQPIFRDNNTFWSLEDELNHLTNYIKIMNYRYGDKARLQMTVSSKLNNTSVPKFLLQPIIENSIIHGLAEKQNGLIVLSAFVDGSELHIRIHDDGIGLNSGDLEKLRQSIGEKNTSKKVGLSNIHQRLQLHYGSQYGLILRSSPDEGFTVDTVIPYTNPVLFS